MNLNSWVSFFYTWDGGDVLHLLLWFYFPSKHDAALQTASKVLWQVSNSIEYGRGGKRKQTETKVLEHALQCSGQSCFYCPVCREPISTPWAAEDPKSRKLLLASIPLSQRLCYPYCSGLCWAELRDPARLKVQEKCFPWRTRAENSLLWEQ